MTDLLANVSVLIPHKDSTESLDKLLNSIPSSVPIIVVDDDSRDDEYSRLISLERKFKNLNVYRNFEENNAGNARNLALDQVTTDWVIFADADDYFNRNYLDKLIHNLEFEKSDVVLFNVNSINKLTGLPSKRAKVYSQLIDDWPRSSTEILYCWPVPWGKAIRTNVIKLNGLRFASRIASNDVEFSAHLAVLKPMISVYSGIVYTCVESSTSLTATLTMHKAKDRVKAATNRNRLFLKNSAPVPLNYNLKYFICSIPILCSEKDFRFFGVYLNTFVRCVLHNLKLR